MSGDAKLIEGSHPRQGRLFACVDPAVRFVSGEVRGSRLAALLAPFKSDSEARAALVAAGCKLEGGGA